MISIHGYAIVSADDRIADASGATPSALMNAADWAYFQAGLDAADIVVLGRLGHEANPNLKGRRRLVVSTASPGLQARPDGHWWNPGRMPWSEVVATLLPGGGQVAVPGGQGVFDLFLGIGYDIFHLSRAPNVTLGEGRLLFAACEEGVSAEHVLASTGLAAGPLKALDPGPPVTLTLWRRDRQAG